MGLRGINLAQAFEKPEGNSNLPTITVMEPGQRVGRGCPVWNGSLSEGSKKGTVDWKIAFGDR